MTRSVASKLAFVLAWLLPAAAAATEYHVSADGDDGNGGTSDSPWKTIQKAADSMQAGDICTVHAGTYREWVNPVNGGASDSPIVYRAADGEDVFIKGSEQITTWSADGNLWKAVVPNTTFGSFNPYSTNISGSYLTYGSEYHLGDVYLNGAPYSEVLNKTDAGSTEKTWYVEVDGTNTTIWANFAGDNPNDGLAEINVRKYVFAPSTAGLGYITIQGFHILQGSTNWAPPDAEQDGMIRTNWGLGWTIENNHISDGKSVCLCSGRVDGGGSDAIDAVGNHVIRNNTIERCGQAGIAGSHGAPATLIEGNLIQEINPTRHFGGYETGGIKIHTAVDVVIKGNIIRNVYAGASPSHPGIWLDWQSQGSRITGNVIYGVEQSLIELEADHGPTLIDNNVLVNGGNLWEDSEATIFVHNLMANAGWDFGGGDGRTPGYFNPHTTSSAGTSSITPRDDHFFNNIFVQKGTSGMPQATGYASDYNVFYAGAAKSSWGDASSIVNGFDPAFTVTSQDDGVTITFNADSAPTDVACPVITKDFIGSVSLANQGIENHDASGITIDTDMTGAARDATHPTAGPFETLSSGANTFTFTAGADGPNASGSGGTGSGSGGTSGNGTAGNATSGGASAAGGSGSASGGALGSSGTAGSPTGTGGTANAASGGAAGAAEPDGSSGCGCRVPRARGPISAAPLGLLLLALGSLRRRRS